VTAAYLGAEGAAGEAGEPATRAEEAGRE
jgi:hypothetical protein